MLIHFKIGPLAVYMVLGRHYDVMSDEMERTCFRMAWRGQPKVRWG